MFICFIHTSGAVISRKGPWSTPSCGLSFHRHIALPGHRRGRGRWRDLWVFDVRTGRHEPHRGGAALSRHLLRKGALCDERARPFPRRLAWEQERTLIENVESMDKVVELGWLISFGEGPWGCDAGIFIWCTQRKVGRLSHGVLFEPWWISGERRGLAACTLASLQEYDANPRRHLPEETWVIHELPRRALTAPAVVLHSINGWGRIASRYTRKRFAGP